MFCHRMSSEKPSSVKSPVPIAFQLGPGLGLTGPPPIRLFPFMSQTAAWPLAFRHRMSEWPSWLKSPVPISVQFGPGLGLTAPPPTRVLPPISQIEAWPSVFCQRMSPVTVGGGGGVTAAQGDRRQVNRIGHEPRWAGGHDMGAGERPVALPEALGPG